MQVHDLEEIDPMTRREEDRQWVLDQVKEHLKPFTELPDLHGIRKIFRALHRWSILGPMIAATVAISLFIANDLSRDAEFRGSTDQRLKTIEQTLIRIEGKQNISQAQIVVQKFSALPRTELKQHHDELANTKATLASVPRDMDNFWPTAFQVIELLSQSTFADFDKIAVKPESEIDDVTSRPPGQMGIFENKKFVLKEHVEGLIFRNSIIRFDPSVVLVNDVFINCVFLLPTQNNPSGPLQEIGRTLLSSDLSNVTLNAS